MSGLPVNTKRQAQEYRKQYLAYLALEAQNDAYNMMANQVYKQTGQPSRPPDTRTTTEKLGDLEQLRVTLLNELMAITDGQMAAETVADLTNDEIIFTSQMIPAIVADLKPKFARGVPSQALLSYIRALRRKELATSGVSFTAQESTAQSILNALMAGRAVGAPLPPFAPPGTPASTVLSTPISSLTASTPISSLTASSPATFIPTPSTLTTFSPMEELIRPVPIRLQPPAPISRTQTGETGRRSNPLQEAILQRAEQMGRSAEEVSRRSEQSMQQQQREIEEMRMRAEMQARAPKKIEIASVEQFIITPWRNIRQWWDDWSEQYTELMAYVPAGILVTRGNNEGRLLDKPTGMTQTEAKRRMVPAFEKFLELRAFERPDVEPVMEMEKAGLPVIGLGMRPRGNQPSSRFPTGREILGYGLSKPKSKAVSIDMTQGVMNTAPVFVPFGKYIINPSKLSRGYIEVKTMNGGKLSKYPERRLSPNLTKVMRRMLEDRMPDEYDFNEMDLEDQNYLFNLTKDAKINERLNIPTPKLSKDGEEQNRFEILKGQIQAGNDNKEMVKEFKQLILKFSDDGRLKKSDAREILLDLTALGY